MSLDDRIKFESNQIDPITFHQENCFKCKFWVHRVRKDLRYCHKCINNLNVSIKKNKEGFSIEGLHDYFTPIAPVKKRTKESTL